MSFLKVKLVVFVLVELLHYFVNLLLDPIIHQICLFDEFVCIHRGITCTLVRSRCLRASCLTLHAEVWIIYSKSQRLIVISGSEC